MYLTQSVLVVMAGPLFRLGTRQMCGMQPDATIRRTITADRMVPDYGRPGRPSDRHVESVERSSRRLNQTNIRGVREYRPRCLS